MRDFYAGRDQITYSPMKPPSSEPAPCLQRFSTGRWKLCFLLLIVVMVVFTVLYTGCFRPVVVSNPTTSLHLQSQAVNKPTGEPTQGTEKPELPQQQQNPLQQPEPENPISDNDEPQQHLPHFIIIGVKKAGTRALLNFLNMHPDIEVSAKEVHFFDRDESYSKGLEFYRTLMPFSSRDQLTGEKSPSYYRIPEAPARIHHMNSSIRLILVVREPIERSMSNYLQFSVKEDDYPPFDDQVLIEGGEVNGDSPLVKNSDYSRFVDNWLKYFDKSQLSVVDGNLLIKNPYLVIKELQDFLGLRNYIDENFFKFDEQKGFYCYYNHSKTDLKCLGDSKGRPHPPINPQTKQKLYEYFKPRNEAFFSKIGRTFDWKVDLSS